MRRNIAALAACASIVAAQNTTSTSIDVAAISVAVPTTVFNLPVVYVTAENAATVTATTLATTATASSDPSATDVFDSAADASAAISSASEAAAATSTSLDKRDATCVAQPTGISYNSNPDTPASFAADTWYSDAAGAVSVPAGYVQTFEALTASNSADNYMGYTLLSSYDVETCAEKCTDISGCNAFNIYFERDPSLNPDDDSCSDPDSTINVKCVFWGGAVTTANANNYGQWRNEFQVLVAGSSGYVNSTYAASLTSTTTTSSSIPSQTTDAAGTVYSLYASSDSTQGSYTNAAASSSYADCMTACDAASACNAFTYVGGTNGVGSGTCWLKTQLGSPSSAGANVVSGVKVPNKLTILSAYYSTLDVTAMAKADFVSVNNLVIDTSSLYILFGNDPWYGVQKSLSILYTNGSTTRVFVAVEPSGVYTLAPSGANSAPNCADVVTFPAPSSASIKIISAVWGKAQSTVESVYDNLYSYASSATSFTIGNSLFANVDSWYGTQKSAVIWYYNAAGTLSAIAAREYTTAKFS